ncbi:MAG: hypothetical protein ACREK3_08645 [Gemmatimonadota bacterium]
MTGTASSSRSSLTPLPRLLDALYARVPFGLLDRLAGRPRIAVLTIGGLACLGAALLALVVGISLPAIHDEFAYLLQADTFAQGRLTNPTHPMWQHFETFHVLWQPTYASKYPPAQGLILALGQILGHPVIGVWLSVGLMGAAITWMLFAWVPPRWAVVGGMLLTLQLGITSYWAQSYWGGAVAAAGGALLYGGVRRLLDNPRLRDGVFLGLGLAILANSRPFEGFLVSLPVVALLSWGLIRRGTGRLLAALGVTLAILAVTITMMGYYNYRVTGDFLTMPHKAYTEMYAVTPNFFWQEAPDLSGREFRHPEFEAFFRDYALERYEEMRDPWVFLGRSLGKLMTIHLFFLGPGILALIGLRRAVRDRWVLLAAGIWAVLLLAELFTGTWPHYLAPATGLIFLVMIASLRALHEISSPRLEGRRAVLLIAVFFALSLPLRLLVLDTQEERSPASFAQRRHAVIEELRRRPGRDLVIVDYGPEHNVHREWVYNEADIDEAEIVWARDMGNENEELIDYFRERRIWHLEVNDMTRLREVARRYPARFNTVEQWPHSPEAAFPLSQRADPAPNMVWSRPENSPGTPGT